jgi:hypothetical protein
LITGHIIPSVPEADLPNGGLREVLLQRRFRIESLTMGLALVIKASWRRGEEGGGGGINIVEEESGLGRTASTDDDICPLPYSPLVIWLIELPSSSPGS